MLFNGPACVSVCACLSVCVLSILKIISAIVTVLFFSGPVVLMETNPGFKLGTPAVLVKDEDQINALTSSLGKVEFRWSSGFGSFRVKKRRDKSDSGHIPTLL